MNHAASLHIPVVQAPRKSSASPKRVLIVDDEPLFTELVKAALDRTEKFATKVVNDSSSAIATALEFRPDVILLDVQMPVLDGGDVSRLLQEDPILRSIPVIMVTGLISNDEIAEDSVAMIHGRPALAKPVTAAKLVCSIEQSLAGQL